MKKIFMIVLFTVSLFYGQQAPADSVISQKELIGFWQKGLKVIGSGLSSNYRFYKNGKFIFRVSEYANALYNLVAVYGKYEILNGKVYLKATSYKTSTDGELSACPGYIGDYRYWGFENVKLKIVKIDSVIQTLLPIQTKRSKSGAIIYITIKSSRFHRMSGNPDEYEY